MSVALDWKKLLKQHGFSESQVRQWAERRYPMFASNIALMTYLFLQEKGIELKPRVVGVYQAKKVTDLVVGDRAEIQVLIGAKLGEIHYYGCPECYTKVEERENRYYCSKCGKYVEAEEYSFKRYIAGDDTGSITVVIPPYVEGELEIGKAYKLRGRVQDNSEFSIREFEEIPLPKPVEGEGEEEEEVIEVKVPVKKEVEEKIEEEEEILEEGVEETIEEEVLPAEEIEEETPKVVEEEKKELTEIEEISTKAGVKLGDKEKTMLKKLMDFLSERNRVRVSEIKENLGVEYITLITVLRKAGVASIKKQKGVYYVVFKPPKKKETVQTKLVVEDKDIKVVIDKVKSMLELFGRISMDDFKAWYDKLSVPNKPPLEELLKRVDFIEVKDGMISKKE